MSVARDWALRELDQVRLPGWGTRLVRRAVAPPEDPRDQALAEQIWIGSVKFHLALRRRLTAVAHRPAQRVDELVQKILHIGLYQVGMLDRIPSSAAVDEAVEQAKRFGRTAAAGFVNAVLREAIRTPATPEPSAADQPHAYAQHVLSHPRELFQRLLDRVGLVHALELCRHNNRVPPIVVRLMPDGTLQDLQRAGVQVIQHDTPGLLVVPSASRSLLAAWARKGWAQAQDATSASVVEWMDLEPGHAVLDRCCGSGTKTLQIFEKLRGAGRLVAMDSSGLRISTFRELLRDRKITTIELVRASKVAEIPNCPGEGFDRVLVDAPCSNSGVLSRRAEARYAQDFDTLKSLALLQEEILIDTAGVVKVGGLLVYATCSIWKEENRGMVDRFLRGHPNFELLRDVETLPKSDGSPSSYRDGGYTAVLKRVF
jgi:16S rRNA (cytosine967-C5)-methyltransferase